VIPSARECEEHDELTLDPLAESRDSPVAGLVHRYENRALLLVTNKCAVYCRYCNRRRCAQGGERDATILEMQNWLTYLKTHDEIEEVILSGGDPLTVNDEHLNSLLGALREVPNVKIVRICSRIPVVLPFRVTADLCALLKKHQPLYLNIHVNHPGELSEDMRRSCEMLADAGIPLGSQTVLLGGVNDAAPVLKALFARLLAYRIKPYSLYHADPVRGTAHFRIPLARGLEIMRTLIADLSGLAVPHYVLDAPHGLGKIPLLPETFLGENGAYVRLRSLVGEPIRYPDGEV
jgi:lysine 2,3-aminomutase